MFIDSATRQGQVIFTTLVIPNSLNPANPFRTPFTLSLPEGQKLPTPGNSIEGDLVTGWFNSVATTTEKEAFMADPAPPTPPVVAPDVPAFDPEKVPVSPRQIRLALTQLGLRDAAEAYVASQDANVKDNWMYSTQFTPDNELIAAAVVALGKTDEDRLALFALARTL